MVSVYNYFDIHEFLKADFEERKKKNPAFSIRSMAYKLGIHSSTLTRIFNGTRKITNNLTPKFIKFLGLRNREAEYFNTLLIFSYSKVEKEKMSAFRELMRLRSIMAKKIPESKYELYEEWYITTVRELLRFYPFKGDFVELSRMFEPPITVFEAKKAINVLLKLELIRKREDSSYEVCDTHITTGEVWHNLAVQKFHVDTLHKALEAIEHIPREERDFSTMTMCYSPEGYKKVRELLRRTRQELMQIEELDKDRNRVYQINFQVFPLSRIYNRGHE